MKVYISGPMTGYHLLNRGAFESAAHLLAGFGHEPIDPGEGAPSGLSWTDYMRRDLALLLGCDAVLVLPGWEASRGAVLEVKVAHALGMNVIPVGTWNTMELAR